MFEQGIKADQQYFPRISQSDLNSKFKGLIQIDIESLNVVKRGLNQKGEKVVLKYFKKEALQYFRRFFQELQNLKKLNHPNIIKLYDFYSLSDNEFIKVTEYCSGGTLKNWIKKGLNQQNKYSICLHIAEGLDYFHSHNMISLNLKPQNIFMSDNGVAKIDFFGRSTVPANHETFIKSMLGYPAQINKSVIDGEYNRKIDIYSLGLVYFYVFKGYELFNNSCSLEKILEIKDKLYRNYDEEMKQVLQNINPTMQEIIKSCLSKEEKLRWTPYLIAKKIKKAQQSLSFQSKVQLTSDCQSKKDELKLSEKFTCRIINFHNFLSKNRKIEATKRQLFETFLHNQQNLNKLESIQQLLFVKEATKAQFTVIALLYYMLWLNEFQAIITGEESSLAQDKRSIDKGEINHQMAEELIIQINAERARVKPVLKRCSQISRNQLKLMKETAYLPQKFKDMLQFGLIGSQKCSQTIKMINLKQQMTTFFQRRIKKEYFSECKDDILDERLKIIGQIGKGFI